MMILTLGTAFFVFGLMYVIFSHSFNVPIQGFNDFIAGGMVSQDTKDALEMAFDMWKASPFFVVIGLILYAFERSKGTVISAQLYLEYLFLMIIGIVFSTFLVYGLGIAMDSITAAMDATAIVNVGEAWEVSSDRHFYIKLMYYILMLPAWLTSLLYMFFPIIQQRENTFFTMDDDEPDFAEDVEMALGQF
jgi:hypothetical protein